MHILKGNDTVGKHLELVGPWAGLHLETTGLLAFLDCVLSTGLHILSFTDEPSPNLLIFWLWFIVSNRRFIQLYLYESSFDKCVCR